VLRKPARPSCRTPSRRQPANPLPPPKVDDSARPSPCPETAAIPANTVCRAPEQRAHSIPPKMGRTRCHKRLLAPYAMSDTQTRQKRHSESVQGECTQCTFGIPVGRQSTSALPVAPSDSTVARLYRSPQSTAEGTAQGRPLEHGRLGGRSANGLQGPVHRTRSAVQ